PAHPTLPCPLLPLPPHPTLFPYTTLFRSGSSQPAKGQIATMKSSLEMHRARALTLRFSAAWWLTWRLGRACRCSQLLVREADLGDRKSTRLNSSHVSISYAVFCLKKKRRH